jgi:glycosyltransferase involved in cell wall biosynthesis
LKILFIHTRYLHSAGGEDTTVEAESTLMRSRGHDVHVHLFDNSTMESGFTGKLKAGISGIYNRSSAREIEEVVSQFKPDVVHVHNLFFTASPSILTALHKKKIPVVATIQNYRLICANALLLRNNKVCELCVSHDFPWYGVKYKCYHHSAVQSAAVGMIAAIHKWTGTWKNSVDRYITPSAFARDKLIHSSFGVPPHKIEIKRNFIADPGNSDVAARKNYFLFVGRLATEKGVQVLLEAWKDLPGEQLIIAGDGQERQALVSKYGSLKNVQFVGHKNKDEVLQLMKNCRALLFPSIWYEGLPLTIVEAFATGTPVIGSAIGAVSEMINDRYNGLLFETGNPANLKHVIGLFNQLLFEKSWSLYENARKSYVQKYHPEQCYADSMRIYENAINNRQS